MPPMQAKGRQRHALLKICLVDGLLDGKTRDLSDRANLLQSGYICLFSIHLSPVRPQVPTIHRNKITACNGFRRRYCAGYRGRLWSASWQLRV